MKLENNNLAKAFLTFLILILIINLGLIAPYLLALFLGWMLAMLMRPFHLRMTAKKIKAHWAALASTLIVTFTIIIPVGVFTALTIQSLGKLFKAAGKEGIGKEYLVTKLENIPFLSRLFDDRDALMEQLQSISQSAVEFVTTFISTHLGNAPELFLQITLALLTCYFVLVDGKKFANWISPKIPLDDAYKTHLSQTLVETAVSSFWATVAAAGAQAIIVLIAFIVLDVPMKTLAFGMAFIFAWLPIVGVTPVWVAGLIFLLIGGHTGGAIAMAGFGALAGLADNIVRPWVIRGSADIHPLVSLVVIFGAIRYFGIIGVFVGPVIVATLIVFLELWPKPMNELSLD
jgi:predicted PurR-regulated permease PerM